VFVKIFKKKLQNFQKKQIFQRKSKMRIELTLETIFKKSFISSLYFKTRIELTLETFLQKKTAPIKDGDHMSRAPL
jgi:hypothetical protein